MIAHLSGSFSYNFRNGFKIKSPIRKMPHFKVCLPNRSAIMSTREHNCFLRTVRQVLANLS